MTVSARSLLQAAVLGVALVLALSACGRRGPLEAPPGGKTFPGHPEEIAQPDESDGATVERRDQGITSPLGRSQSRRTPIERPKTPFILDPLL